MDYCFGKYGIPSHIDIHVIRFMNSVMNVLQQHSEMSKAPGKPTDPALHFTKFTPGEKYFVRQLIINPNKEV